MKNKELREKIIAFNKITAERRGKANDLDILIGSLAELPPGQLKKVLTDDVVSVLQKYGVEIN